MANPTDTNQASEDELDERLTNIIQSVTLEHPVIGEHTLWDISPSAEQAEWGYILFKQLKSLIRTEKLKLLDEVIHQSTVNLKSAKAVAGWAELRKEQLEQRETKGGEIA